MSIIPSSSLFCTEERGHFTQSGVIVCGKTKLYSNSKNVIEPVFSGTVLGDHPLLSGRLSKSRICFPLINHCNFHFYKAVAVNFELVPTPCFVLSSTCIYWSLKVELLN